MPIAVATSKTQVRINVGDNKQIIHFKSTVLVLVSDRKPKYKTTKV